jgi:ribosomal protein S26
LTKAGIDIKCSEKQVEWFGNAISLCNPSEFTPEEDMAVCLNSMQLDVDGDFLSDHLDEEDIYDNYAVGKILDVMYEKRMCLTLSKCKLTSMHNSKVNSWKCSPSIRRFLAMTLAAIHTSNFTLIFSLTPSQCIDEPILYQDFTRRPSKKNWSIWYVSACSLLKAAANEDCLHSSHPKKMAVFDGLVTSVN